MAALAVGAFVMTATFGSPARAGMRIPTPLATHIVQADAVVLGRVTAVHETEVDGVRTVRLGVDVTQSLPLRPYEGQLLVRVVQKGLDITADFGSRYAVGETRLFVLDRDDDGAFVQRLFVAPTLSQAAPAHAHPRSRGARWLVLPDWSYGGVQFPAELPLTFATETGERRCDHDELNTFVAWFTWEDLASLAWPDLDASRVQLAPPRPCNPLAPFPVAIRCSPERCPKTAWWEHDAITCSGRAGTVTLTRVEPGRFRVAGALKGRRLPRQVRARFDDSQQTLHLVADTPSRGTPQGGTLLELTAPWYVVIAMESATGAPPPPPSLSMQASAPGGRHPEDTLSLLCTAP